MHFKIQRLGKPYSWKEIYPGPGGPYIWRGNLTEGFLRYEFGGLIFGGAYTWRGLFSEFYGIHISFSVINSVCNYSRTSIIWTRWDQTKKSE